MSEGLGNALGGEFATRRGSIAADLDFIMAQKARGVPPSAVAQMLRRNVNDVRAIMGADVCATRKPVVERPGRQNLRRLSKRGRPAPRDLPAAARPLVERVAVKRGHRLCDLLGDARNPALAHARQEAYYVLYATGRYSMPVIGAFFGGRDHTTILHGVRAHKKRLQAAADERAARKARQEARPKGWRPYVKRGGEPTPDQVLWMNLGGGR